MLSTIVATRFDKLLAAGRTTPALMACERGDGTEVEAVVKFSAACERGVTALAIEAVSAMLAADLGLPVPEPFLVLVEPDVIDAASSARGHDLALRSVKPCIGSKRLPVAFLAVSSDKPLSAAFQGTAAEIFAFDAMILNPDRRHAKPNCLSDGRSIAIIDHEAALTGLDILGNFLQPYPWTPGALASMGFGQGQHLFCSPLKGKGLAFDRLIGAWAVVTDARLTAYREALPPSWAAADPVLDRAMEYIAELRQHVPAVIDEVMRVLA
jgi:hypothetical protein